MTYLSHTKNMENLMEVLLRDHERYMPIVQFLDNIILNMSELSWAESELIGLELDKQNRSEFCSLIRVGMIKALNADKSALESEKLEPVLAFARKLNQDASTITQSDVQAMRDAGWSDQTVEDVVGLVASLKVYTILAHGLGFKTMPESVFAEMGQATVQMGGYTPVFQSYIEKSSGQGKAS